MDAQARTLPAEELDEVLHHARGAFETLRGARVFITGGTGFFGHWLVESLLHADTALELGLRVTLLTRSRARLSERSPHLTDDYRVDVLEGDVASFAFPREPHTHVVHAAADSSVSAGASAAALPEAIIDGTRHVLKFALATGAQRMLYVSSGAVYGRGITDVTSIAETYRGGPDPLALVSGYDEGKRMAEHLCVAYTQGTPLVCSVGRAFAFVGPHLPLDAHFAIGNFIRDAMRGEAVRIAGDGTPLRSFLYMTDLAAWLWTVLARGERNRAYNVGSGEAVSIAELARVTADALPHNGEAVPVTIAGTPAPDARPATYVPDVTRAHAELGLSVTVPLPEAIRRTARWYGFPADAR